MANPSSAAHTSALGRLIRYAKPHRTDVWMASFYSVTNKTFDLAPPVLIGAAVDVVVRKKDSLIADLGITDLHSQLIWLAAATVLVWGLESLFEYLFQRRWRELAQTLQHELRIDAFAHTTTLELAYFQGRDTGGLLSVLGDDVNQLERFLDGGANDLLQVGTTVVLISAAFFAIAPDIALATITPVPFVVVGSFYFQSRIAGRYEAVRARAADVNARLVTSLTGMGVIKAFTAEEREVERLRKTSNAYRAANSRAIALSSAFVPLIRMVIVVGFVATLIMGGDAVLRGDMAVGSYSVMVFMTQRLLWPLTRLGATFDLYQRAMASTRRVLDLLDTTSKVVDGAKTLHPVRGEIAWEDVRFAYPGRPALLQGMTLKVPAGGSLGVVGTTGAGKSTLVALLLRLFDVDTGRVTLDGEDVRELTLKSLRDAIGLVSQDVLLFSGTLRENLAYGRPDASDADIEAAAKAAEAHGFIAELPKGYDTLVGERGHRLSGGQRQRIAIARALLVDPPVLVLDEATSAVDNETEAAIQRSLARIIANRTTLIIAHRLSTVRQCDRVVVLEAGAVVESGSHDELVALGGRYARLWAVQTGEELGPQEQVA
ncbi:MAG: ABC transporter ATP-binding protein [Myxococcales bacterium]|nr:ABC transporter ATP-binding protein [Myxococcales bacterium]